MSFTRSALALIAVSPLFVATAFAQDANSAKPGETVGVPAESSGKTSTSKRSKRADEVKKGDETAKVDEGKRVEEPKKVDEPKKLDEGKKLDEPKKVDDHRRVEPKVGKGVLEAKAIASKEEPLDTSYNDLNFTLRIQLETESSPNDTKGSAPEIGAGIAYGHSFSSGVEPFVEAEYITYSDTFTGGSMSSTSINLGVGILFNLYPHKTVEAGALRPYGGAIIVRTDQTVKSQLEGDSEFTRKVTDMNTQFVFGAKYFMTQEMALNPQMRFFTTNGDRTAGSAKMSSKRLGVDLRILGLTYIF